MDYTEEFKMITNPFMIHFLLFCHRIKEFMLSEFKHRAFQLSYVFPSAITKFLNLFTQSYVGNITIWPVPSIANYLRIMENPVHFDVIMNFVEDGRSRTYPSNFFVIDRNLRDKRLTVYGKTTLKLLQKDQKVIFLCKLKTFDRSRRRRRVHQKRRQYNRRHHS